MARTYSYRVELERDLPEWLLSHPDLPPAILEARRAFEAAQAEIHVAREKVKEIEKEIEANKDAIRRAIEEGKKPPAPIPELIAEERIRHAKRNVRRAVERTVEAAEAYEQSIPQHREALRPILEAKLPELAAKAANAIREAEEAYKIAKDAASLIRFLDYRAAESVSAHRSALLTLVENHYRQAEKKDPMYLEGRLSRIKEAWKDVKAVVTGIPVDYYVSDPLADPDVKLGYEISNTIARAREDFERKILGY